MQSRVFHPVRELGSVIIIVPVAPKVTAMWKVTTIAVRKIFMLSKNAYRTRGRGGRYCCCWWGWAAAGISIALNKRLSQGFTVTRTTLFAATTAAIKEVAIQKRQSK